MQVCQCCGSLCSVDGLRIDPDRKQAQWPGGQVQLRLTEAKLLSSLAGAAGRVVRLDALIDAVWGDDVDGGPDNARKSVYVHMCYLRRRLAASRFPGRIANHHGVGYELMLAA
jgi:DNA-binding response OmpR family regulator